MARLSSDVPLIVGLSGSLRQDSYNTAALRACAALLGERARFELAGIAGIPVYNEDERTAASFPAPVLALAEALERADAVIIATPEYNFSIPGGLKNALDWVSRLPRQPLRHKRVAVLGAATGKLGSARAQYHLRQVLQCMEAQVMCKPEVFLSDAQRLFEAGRLTDADALAALSPGSTRCSSRARARRPARPPEVPSHNAERCYRCFPPRTPS